METSSTLTTPLVTMSAGCGEHFVRDLDIPTLLIESDVEDPRYFSEAQLRNRIDAFFAALEQRRITAGQVTRAGAKTPQAGIGANK
jgi:hypothetical protein